MTDEERQQILAEAYANVAELEGAEKRWAAEAAEREGRTYWQTKSESAAPRPKRERGLDTSPAPPILSEAQVEAIGIVLSEFRSQLRHEIKAAHVDGFTETQVKAIGIALAEVRKQARDEIEVARVELRTAAVLLREEIDALRSAVDFLRGEFAALRDKNVVTLPRLVDAA